MNRLIYTFICCTPLFIGCNKPSKYQGLEMNFEEIIHIPLPNIEDSFLFKFSSAISDIKYVKLEETTNSIIGNLSQLEIANNGDFIVFDIGNKKVLRFDSCGHFLNAIGERGHGPNEYVDPFYMSYDSYHNQVMITDYGKQQILSYKLTGEITNRINTPYYNCGIQPLDKEHTLYYRSYNNSEGYNFIVNKNESSECTYFDPLPEKDLLSYSPCLVGAITNGDGNKILCRPPYSSIIYEIDGTKVRPKYQLDFNTSVWLLGTTKDLENVFNSKAKNSIFSLFEVNDKLFMSCTIGNHGYKYYYDPKGKSLAGKYMKNDIDGKYNIFSIIKAKGKRFYSECIADYFADKAKNSTEFIEKNGKGINPWIMICTVKD